MCGFRAPFRGVTEFLVCFPTKQGVRGIYGDADNLPLGMKLLIDIGNTCTKLAVGCSGKEGHKGEIVYIERKDDAESWTSLFSRLGSIYPLSACAVSCVGHYDASLPEVLRQQPYPFIWLRYDTPCMLRDTPQGYGSDRLADDLGAIAVLREQMPHATAEDITRHGLLVIDAGTCITYDFIQHCRVASGVISPGAQLRLRAMHDHSALLPLINLDTPDFDHLHYNLYGQGDAVQASRQPAHHVTPLLGTNTEDCMLSAALHGIRFEIEGYIRALQRKYPRLRVCLTGGNRFEMSPDVSARCLYHPNLVLYGLLSIV